MRMRRLAYFAVFLLLGATGLFAQQVTVNLSETTPPQIDFSQVDLSGVQFYYESPFELFVTGVRYNGYVYSAILSYSGNGDLTVKPPRAITTVGKPQTIDLSRITVSLAQAGVELHNVGIDGMSYSGTLTYLPPDKFAISDYRQTGTMGEAQQATVQVSALQDQVGTLQNRVNSLESDVSAKDGTITNLQEQVSSQNQTITNLQQQVSSQNQTITNLQQQVTSKDQMISSLHQQVSSRDQTISTLRDQLTEHLAAQAVPTASDYPVQIGSGFGQGTGSFGDWVASGGTLSQVDARALFAKFTLPVPQTEMRYFYQFSAHATGTGWHGYGLHFLAGGSDTPKGYGYGRSYLVWVTQDPEHLQTDKTFVQLYRSYDDVHMIQLANKAISGSIHESNTISVAVNVPDDLITVIANGDEIFSYHPPEGIGPGHMVAFRALGSVTFTSAQLRTK